MPSFILRTASWPLGRASGLGTWRPNGLRSTLVEQRMANKQMTQSSCAHGTASFSTCENGTIWERLWCRTGLERHKADIVDIVDTTNLERSILPTLECNHVGGEEPRVRHASVRPVHATPADKTTSLNSTERCRQHGLIAGQSRGMRPPFSSYTAWVRNIMLVNKLLITAKRIDIGARFRRALETSTDSRGGAFCLSSRPCTSAHNE